jgi:hypothetical protein
MGPLIPTLLLSVLSAADLPDALTREVDRALAVPNARARVVEFRPSLRDCAVSSARVAPILGSGSVAARLYGESKLGAPCEGWAWVKVQVFAKALVTTRAVLAAERLAAATQLEEREIRPGQNPLALLPDDAVATRLLGAGVVLDRSQVRGPGPALGAPITVLARAGSITLEQPGRVAPCPVNRACALLPSGKRVEGHLEDGRLVVEIP